MTKSRLEMQGRELARQIHALHALKDERKEKMAEFRTREDTILKEINRLAMDVRTGQTSIPMDEQP